MNPEETGAGDQRGPSQPIWSAILVTVVALVGAAWLVVSGVDAKEECSATVGAVETGSGLYRPCELVGYLEVTAWYPLPPSCLWSS